MSVPTTIDVQGGDPLVVEVILPPVHSIDIEAKLDAAPLVEMVLEPPPGLVDLVVVPGGTAVDLAYTGTIWVQV